MVCRPILLLALCAVVWALPQLTLLPDDNIANAVGVDVIVSFAGPGQALRDVEEEAAAGGAGGPTRAALRDALVGHADEHQREVVSFLEDLAPTATWTQLWIDNSLAVSSLPASLVAPLMALPGVRSVRADAAVHLPTLDAVDDGMVESDVPQGNIAALNVGPLWAAGHTGAGVTVATIDSGVRWTHEALAGSYRGYRGAGASADHDYNYWTKDGGPMTPDTADIYGHGTHVTGTLAGSGPYHIGMAPNATWIHAKAFGWDGSTSQSTLIAAAQWTMCPTPYGHKNVTGDCSKGANIVSGSFGGNSSLTWLNPTVSTLRAAGIIATFASGNVNAFKCGSVMEPGGSDDAIAVGGVNDGELYPSSGKGPGLDGKTVKPDFVAPSFAIRSSLSAADSGHDAYTRMTGTSMATPHVAGALALLLSAAPARVTGMDARAEQGAGEAALRALRSTAATKDLKKPILAPSTCGGTAWNTFPNNLYGWGLPDVCAAAVSLGVQCSSTSS